MKLFYLFSFFIIIIFIYPTTTQFPLKINKAGKRFCKFPKANGVITTNKTLMINNHTDFGMKRIFFNGAKNTCSPKMPPMWEHAIIIQDGGSVSNVILGISPEGTSADIYCWGSCTLTNVYFEKVCWRGATFAQGPNFKKGDKTQFTYTVNGGGALDGFQKIFLQGGQGKTIINNFCSVNNDIGIVSCGNCINQYHREITIQNSKFMGPTLTIAGGNPGDKIVLKNVEVYGDNNSSSKIKFACSEYMGQSVQNPWANSYKLGQAGGKSCSYAANAVKLVN